MSKETDYTRMRFPHKLAAVGGTFDVFHLGHEQLLSRAFDVGERVLIGVTSDALLAKLAKKHSVQPYPTRTRQLRGFLRRKRWSARAVISPLQDAFGPARSRKDLEAIVVTSNTFANAKILNVLRREKGLGALQIYQVRLSKADDEKPISSTRIRKGEIDREGRILMG